MKLFIKTVLYTFRLVFRSSGAVILLDFLLRIACAMLPLLGTYLMRDILNLLTASSARSAMICVALYIISLVLLQVCRSAMEVCYDTYTKKAELQYITELNQKMVSLPMSFLDSSEGKNLVDEVRYLQRVVVSFPNYMIQVTAALFAFAAAFSALAAFHFGFSVLFLLLTVPGLLLQFHFRKKADVLRRKTAPDVRRFSYYRWMLTDAWPAKDVRTYDLTEPIKARYDEEKDVYRAANKRLDKRKTGFAVLAEIMMRSGEIVFGIFVVLQAISGRIAIGDMVLYISFALAVTDSFQNMMGTVLYGIIRSVQNMKYVFAFQAYESSQKTLGTRKLGAFESLVFDNVYFRYPKTDRYILSGVSFTLHRGDKLSLVGVNGAGKSTVIKLMLGLYEAESGRILINGCPMSDYDMRDIHGLFSVLFQNFVQYPLSLRENIALSDLTGSADDKRIEAAMRKSGGYNEILQKTENGFDSYMTRMFDDAGTELSKGQWQKVALARTYFKDAPIVIFDEPSAALDAEAEDRIFRSFEEISGGRTGIMISHRISAARMSDQILVLDGGKIAEQGTHEVLVAKGGLYAMLYGVQKEKYSVKEE